MLFISRIWKLLGKKSQWLIIWLMHAKFNVGVSILIPNNKGEVLLGKHVFSGDKPWRLIGGYINKEEHIFAAAKREAREELGIDIDIERLLRVRTGFAYRIEFTLIAKPIDSDISRLKIDIKELNEVGWFKPGEEPEDTLDSHKHLISLFVETPAGYLGVDEA